MSSDRQSTPAPTEHDTQQSSPKITAPLTPFEQAIRTWSEIGLTSLQQALDDQGEEILENQKASVASRKELASRTKTFKKLSDEEKIIEVKSLLKLYQSEIDNLTKRGKFAETSFINLYKLLAEAPDPTPLLEASIDSVLAAAEASKLSKENAVLADKLTRYADYEQIKAKLMQVELKSIENVASKVTAKEAEMKAIIDEKERHWAEKEAELAKQVQEARAQVKELRSHNEVIQARLSAQSGDQLAGTISDDAAARNAGRIAELELVASDLERAKRRTLEVEKRNVELRSELEAVKSGVNDKDEALKLESQISDLQRENTLLAAQLETTRSSSNQAKSSIQKQVDQLQRDLLRKSAESESLREKLSSMQDYSEVKKELEILKAIEFDYDMNSDDEDSNREGKVNEEKSNTESLEKLMLARNKKLTDDLTVIRVANKDLTEELNKLKAQLSTKTAELDKTKSLNQKLEDDLLKTNGGARISSSMSVVSNWQRGGTARSGRISPTSSIIGGDTGDTSSIISGQTNNGGDTSILPIITQQRDRFKARNTELEEELRKNWSTINTLRKEIEAVKHDNVELYEKARYASSYKYANSNPNVSSTEERYRTVYEEGLSPFQQFKGRESERALSKMGPIERYIYSFTRIILVNRFGRNLFMVYCLVLHFLVMIILILGVNYQSSALPTPEHAFVAHDAADAIPELPETAVRIAENI